MNQIYNAYPLESGELLITKTQGVAVRPVRVVWGAMSVAAHVLAHRPRDLQGVLAQLGTSIYELKRRWVLQRRALRQGSGRKLRLKYESFADALDRLA